MNLNLDFTFLNWGVIGSFIAKGFYFSVQLTIIAMLGRIAIGTLLALMRLSGKTWLVMPAAAYVNTLRSIPLVMVILWFFLLVPLIIGRPVGAEYSAIITFIAFEAAYFSEIMRAEIQSIPRGQMWAGYALGLSYWQTMGQIVLPQAFRNMLPVLLTQTIILFQDTSLVYVSALADFFGQAYGIGERDGRIVEMLLFAGLVYFIICFSASLLVKRYQKKVAV